MNFMSMNMMHQVIADDNRPSPADIERFLPWACTQLEVEYFVKIRKKVIDPIDLISSEHKHKRRLASIIPSGSTQQITKLKSAKSHISAKSNVVSALSPVPAMSPISAESDDIIIDAIFSEDNHLVHLKFVRYNPVIPREIFKLLNLILKFYPFLTKLTINGGLSAGVLYEISKIFPTSHLTEIILDGSYCKESNYSTLLENPGKLAHLSLARCSISDEVVRNLAEKLVHPSLASKSLSAFNLSSNYITDSGAYAIAQALRSNRRLKYLNLADNMITDEGAKYILESLIEFPLNLKEYITTRKEYLDYVKIKTDLVFKFLVDMKDYTPSKTITKDSSVTKSKRGTSQGKAKQKSIPAKRNNSDMEQLLMYSKAEKKALEQCGEFDSPFKKSEAVTKNGLLHSTGNRILCYLNLSYNHLSYLTLQTVLEVLKQQSVAVGPPGLINIILDGNLMPSQCKELSDIQDILDWKLYNLLPNRKDAVGSQPSKTPRSRKKP